MKISLLQKINRVLLLFFIVSLLMNTVIPADDPPKLPHTFYGTVTINDEPAPIGTEITARVNGENVGSVTTTETGSYGNGTEFNHATNLVVQGISSGTISFYLDGTDTNITYEFNSGAFTELDLNATIVSGGDDDDDDDDDGSPGGSDYLPPTNASPVADANGPYTGLVDQSIQLDGSGSTDSDGTIETYEWDLDDDGNYDDATGVSPTYSWNEEGSYTIALKVTDNDNLTDTNTTTVTITEETILIEPSEDIIEEIEELFDIALSQNFYAEDTDNDGIVDTFVDPNDILTTVHPNPVSINGNTSFLITVDENLSKMFLWDTESDTIIPVTYTLAQITDESEDTDKGTITITTTVDKDDWIYIEFIDQYPQVSTILVKRSDGTYVSDDMIWREDDNIFALDDPSVEYQLIYSSSLSEPMFSPPTGTVFEENKPTITITFDNTVTLIEATLNQNSIDLSTEDDKLFTYSPTEPLANGEYTLLLTIEDSEGFTHSYTAEYTIQAEEGGLPILYIILAIIAIIIIAFVILVKTGYIYFEH